MPKIAKELSPLEVSRLDKTGFNAVGVVPGLGLQIRRQARSWILRVKIGDNVRDIGLGGYPGVTLAMAREAARQMRSKIAAGIDPIQERKVLNDELRAAQQKRLLFVDAFRRFLEDKQSEWNNAKHRQQWENTLQTYAVPVLSNLAVDDIELAHVLEVLKPIWHTKPETAKRTRGRIEKVLDWAKVRGHRDGENPARWQGNLENALPALAKVRLVKHHPALPYHKIGAFIKRLAGNHGIAINIAHHTKKIGGDTESHAGDAESGRGASSIKDAARAAVTIARMGKKTAEKLDIPNEVSGNYIRMDVGYMNFAPHDSKVNWFRTEQVILANRDTVGVPVPENLDAQFAKAQDGRKKWTPETMAMAVSNLFPGTEGQVPWADVKARYMNEHGVGTSVAGNNITLLP